MLAGLTREDATNNEAFGLGGKLRHLKYLGIQRGHASQANSKVV